MNKCYKCQSEDDTQHTDPVDNLEYSICNSCGREFVSKEQIVANEDNKNMMRLDDFFWGSGLDDSRKQEICDWVNSLSKNEQNMLEEIEHDVYEETMFDCHQDENY